MVNKEQIRVRFAPSPTGFLHIGGARTALFNWLFARRHQGSFVLRIEDTDKARSQQVYLQQILEDLKWLGLDWDEGPYLQSQRLNLYQEQAARLLQEGAAYKEDQAVVLKVPGRDYEFADLIRGPIKFPAGALKDQVLIKSDGTPTYNFACCIDERQMRISHVIRGEDHISNTPKQLAIYAALGWEAPLFAHIPLIVTEERARLSKRKGAVPLSHYRQQGYLPDALFNFLALLGWSPDDDSEILSREEIVRRFSLEAVGKAAAYFNPEKLEWMNGQYIQSANTEALAELLKPLLEQKRCIGQDYAQERLLRAIELFKPRMKRLSEFCEQADFFLQEEITLNAQAEYFLRQAKGVKDAFNKLIKALEELACFNEETIEAACRRLIAAEGIKGAELIHPLRIALSGKKVGPGVFEIMAVLGKEKVLKRLKQASQFI